MPGGFLPEPTHPRPGLVLLQGRGVHAEGAQVRGHEVGNNRMY